VREVTEFGFWRVTAVIITSSPTARHP